MDPPTGDVIVTGHTCSPNVTFGRGATALTLPTLPSQNRYTMGICPSGTTNGFLVCLSA